MESNTNNISSAGLHGLDQRQRRAETSEEVDIRQGQNALGSLSLSTGLTPSHNPAERDCGSLFLWATCKRLNSPRCTLASSPILYVFLN